MQGWGRDAAPTAEARAGVLKLTLTLGAGYSFGRKVEGRVFPVYLVEYFCI